MQNLGQKISSTFPSVHIYCTAKLRNGVHKSMTFEQRVSSSQNSIKGLFVLPSYVRYVLQVTFKTLMNVETKVFYYVNFYCFAYVS